MKSKYVIIIVVLVIVVGAGFILFSGNKNSSPANNSSQTNVNTSSSLNNNTNSSSQFVNTNGELPSQASVSVTNDGFSPAVTTISAGGTVTWTNNSSTTVYVAPDIHPTHLKYQGIWDDDGSGQIGPGQSYSFTFNQANTYTYHNHLEPTQTGEIVVK